MTASARIRQERGWWECYAPHPDKTKNIGFSFDVTEDVERIRKEAANATREELLAILVAKTTPEIARALIEE